MTDQIEWSLEMSDEDFAKAAEPYFRKRTITLHEGCCLIAKVNPATKKTTVGEGHEYWTEVDDSEPYDYTRRPFEVALRALNGEEPGFPLIALKRPEYIENAEQVLLTTRTFIRWVLEKWPDTTSGIRLAEELRTQRKMAGPSSFLSPKTKSAIRHEKQHTAFKDLVKSLGGSTSTYSTNKLASMLAAKIKDSDHPAGARSLKDRIKTWRTAFD